MAEEQPIPRSTPTNEGPAQRLGGALPLVPGSLEEERTLSGLELAAREGGLPHARAHGFAGGRRPHGAEAIHALWAGLALLWPGEGLYSLLALLVGGAGAIHRLSGGEGWGAFLPRYPCFSLCLHRIERARLRRIVVIALDAWRPAPPLKGAVLGVYALAAVALSQPESLQDGVAALAGALAVIAWLAGQPIRAAMEGKGRPPSLAASQLRALAGAGMSLARRIEDEGRQDVAVLLSGNAVRAGEGGVAFVDWWGLEDVEVIVASRQEGEASREAAYKRLVITGEGAEERLARVLS